MTPYFYKAGLICFLLPLAPLLSNAVVLGLSVCVMLARVRQAQDGHLQISFGGSTTQESV